METILTSTLKERRGAQPRTEDADQSVVAALPMQLAELTFTIDKDSNVPVNVAGSASEDVDQRSFGSMAQRLESILHACTYRGKSDHREDDW